VAVVVYCRPSDEATVFEAGATWGEVTGKTENPLRPRAPHSDEIRRVSLSSHAANGFVESEGKIAVSWHTEAAFVVWTESCIRIQTLTVCYLGRSKGLLFN
jgi:hypothetical protein